jgi:murein DD-endopeptidase MepM/ murein hydrolase activator NlpD
MLRRVHLILSIGPRNKLVSLSLSLALVRAVLAIALLAPVFVGYLAIDRGRRIADQRQLRTLSYENVTLRGKMDGFAASVDSLRAELARLQELDAQLRLSANLAIPPREVRAMGIGGGSVGSSEPGAELQSSVDWLLQQARFQRSSFQEVAHKLDKQTVLQTRTPSILPTSGWITSLFGYRRDPFTGKTAMHEGLDIVGIPGQAIVATADGAVVIAGPYQNWGNTVEIDHGGGLHTFYAHNQSVLVRVGERAKRGQKIATLGRTGRSTGYHCHYGIKLNGNWVNPQKYLLSDRILYD